MASQFRIHIAWNWMANSHVGIAKSAADIAAVKAIFLEYLEFVAAFLGETLDFQDTAKEFATFPDTYDHVFIGRLDGAPVAACGLKPFAGQDCELKRLYCRVSGRGHGLGARLTKLCIDEARALGYKRMLLDTNPGLHNANKIYEDLGFLDIEKYYENPLPHSRYMALSLI